MLRVKNASDEHIVVKVFSNWNELIIYRLCYFKVDFYSVTIFNICWFFLKTDVKLNYKRFHEPAMLSEHCKFFFWFQGSL